MGGNNVVGFKPVKGLILGEVVVTVLLYQADPVLRHVSKGSGGGSGKGRVQLHIACPNFSTALELKQRIHGMTAIPIERMRLMLCGTVLRDGDRLPTEAFEQTQRTTDDADVFRARMFLSLLPVLDEPKPESIISVLSELDEEELKAAFEAKAKAEEVLRKEAEVMAIREARTKALEVQLLLDHVRPANFDLGSDLEKIHCSAFVHALKKAGFADEGAFAHITDDTLQETGLWIPRKARVRIVALADSIKRRMEVSARTAPGALVDVEKTMVTGGNMVTRGIEGLEENFTTKAQVTKAFQKKAREDRKTKNEAEDRTRLAVVEEQKKREPKPHECETLLLMQHIRWRCETDTFDDLPKHCFRPEPPKFCCKKHEVASIERRGTYISQLKERNLTDLTVQTLAADSLKRCFVPREALKMIALTHLKRHEYDLSEHEVELVLTNSLVSAAQQSRLGAWGREIERKDNPLGIIPAPFYDSRRFVAALADLMEEFDRLRFLSIERPFTMLPYPRK